MRIGFSATAIMAADMGTAAMAAHQVGMNLLGLKGSYQPDYNANVSAEAIAHLKQVMQNIGEL